MTGKRAMVLGASGLIGKAVVNLLLQKEHVQQVLALVRKPMEMEHPKLTQIRVNFETSEVVLSQVKADELYICIGTTRNKTPDLSEYFQIDHDYPVRVAHIAQQAGVKRCAIVSSIGASAKSRQFYLQTKGRLEEDILALNFDKTLIFRPSLLLGKRNERRFLEQASALVLPLLHPLLRGKWKAYRSIPATDVAKAMVTYMEKQEIKLKYYTWEAIKEIA